MKNILVVSLLILGVIFSVDAQPKPDQIVNENPAPKKGMISGKLIEKGSKVPLEYASVAIYQTADSSLVSGGIATSDGRFSIGNLKAGNYYLVAQFIGYKDVTVPEIVIEPQQMKVDVGAIVLFPATEELNEVSVTAQDKPIAYSIDKKVVDPTQFPTAANGTAIDVLANTPSVTVDIEGNVALRGNSNFKVLIDGRPTPFDAADALEQIPTSTIQNIEIITNPSAKYDPDGNAGIINIKTKKSKLNGISGIVNATGDTNGSITGDALVNYRVGKFNFFVSGNRAERVHGGSSIQESMTIAIDTLYTFSYGDNDNRRSSSSVKTGFDYAINDYNSLAFNVSLNNRSGKNDSELDFEETSSNGSLLNSITYNNRERTGNNLGYSLDYKKTFEQEGRELTALFYYESGSSDEVTAYDQYLGNGDLVEGQYGWEVGDDSEWRGQIDYIHPFNQDTKIEAGLQTRNDRSEEWNDVFLYEGEKIDYSPTESSPNYSLTNYSRDLYSTYFMFSQQRNIFGYQLGLRGEYTDRRLNYSEVEGEYEVNRFDYFPTAHISLGLPSDQQLALSYSRRINRPRGYYLEPFITYVDAYNVRRGNPGVEPEYINSYELGYQKTLNDGFISLEAYHRQTNNVIERVQTVFEENVIMRTVDNIGEDYSTGLELMLNTNPTKWWILNLMGNAYHYMLQGEYENRTIDTKSFNWHARMNNTFLLSENTKLQIDGMYHSPSVTAQGRREGFMFTNVALRQDFLNKKLSATLGIRDVLNTAKFEFSSEGENFSTYRKFDMNSPVVSLTLSYKINNYKQKRARGEGEGGGDMMNMDGGDM